MLRAQPQQRDGTAASSKQTSSWYLCGRQLLAACCSPLALIFVLLQVQLVFLPAFVTCGYTLAAIERCCKAAVNPLWRSFWRPSPDLPAPQARPAKPTRAYGFKNSTSTKRRKGRAPRHQHQEKHTDAVACAQSPVRRSCSVRVGVARALVLAWFCFCCWCASAAAMQVNTWGVAGAIGSSLQQLSLHAAESPADVLRRQASHLLAYELEQHSTRFRGIGPANW